MSRRTNVEAVPGIGAHQNITAGLQSVETVLADAKYRHDHRVTLEYSNVTELGIRWHDQGPDKSESGYYAKIDGRELRMSDGAMKTACRLIKTEPKFFNQFPDHDAFPKTFRHILDNPGRNESGVILRHDGLQVNCILPRSYQVRDANELLGDFVGSLNENLGDIKGISVVDEGFGDHTRYYVVMGNNLMPEIDDSLGQYMMFMLSMSETGLQPARTALGLYRTICTNSAVRQQTLSKWNHEGSIGKFYDSTNETIRMTGYLQSQFSKVFGELLKIPLEHDATELLKAMKTAKAISRDHHQLASTYVLTPTEDGRSVETQYDLFNVLTRAAQDLPSLRQREDAEQGAMALFTAEGGLFEELRRQAARNRVREPLGEVLN